MSGHLVEIIGKPAGWYSEWFACCQTCTWRGPVNATQKECREDASAHDGIRPRDRRKIVYTEFRVSDLHRYSNGEIRHAIAWEQEQRREGLKAAIAGLR